MREREREREFGFITHTHTQVLTFVPQINTESVWMTIDDFLMSIAVTGKLYRSGLKPKTPIIRDEVHLGFILSIFTCQVRENFIIKGIKNK